MRKRFTFFTILKNLSFCMSLLFALVSITAAGEIERHFAEYLETLSPDELVSAIIIMADQGDIKSLNGALKAEKANRQDRHERVVSTLQAAASRSQGEIVVYLEEKKKEGSVKGYTQYWIMNLIVVQATAEELERIAARADVEIVEPNFKAEPIEPIRGTDEPAIIPSKGIGVTPGLRAVKADWVWHMLGITGLGRLIANLDTGVDGTHPALTDRWRGNHEPWWECWRDALGGGTTYPVDLVEPPHFNGHGTHVMGTLCGLGAETGDTIGVAWEAEWIADNAIGQYVSLEFDNDVIDAFQWFADPDGDPYTVDDVPDAVQNSWGIDSRWLGYEDCDYRWQGVIENCETAGVVCIFSAGNEGPYPQTLRSPANICNTSTTNFSVGAVDATNYGFPYPIADFSSRGPSDCDGISKKPEVVAPGVEVYSSVPGGWYESRTWNGTSMAGPHVAGVVALMRQVNPDLDVDSIKQILLNTAVDLGSSGEDNDYGWGIIDAFQAVAGLFPPTCGILMVDMDPQSFSIPPLKVAPGGNRIVTFDIRGNYNLGEDFQVTSDHPHVLITGNASGYLSPGETKTVEVTVICYGQEFIRATISVHGCIGTAQDTTFEIPLRAVCSDDYFECDADPATFIEKDNGELHLWSCVNTSEELYDTRIWPDEKEKVIFSGGVIVATSTSEGDTAVGRQDYRDVYTGARDTIKHVCGLCDEEECLIQKIHVRNTYIWTPEPPFDAKWWWIDIHKQLILFHDRPGYTCPEWKKEQIIEYAWIDYGEPPGWWPDPGTYQGHEDIYFGLFADINAPSVEGCFGCNTAGYDYNRQMIWQHGYPDEVHPEYGDHYVGLVFTDETGGTVTPYGVQNVANDEYLYPQDGWGWNDGELYQLASTPGVNIHWPAWVGDRSVVMTADMIPAGSETDFQAEFILIEASIHGDPGNGLTQLQVHMDDARNILIPELASLELFDKDWRFPICADVMPNGIIDSGDLVRLIGYVFLGESPPPWPKECRADVTGNGVIDSGDIVRLIGCVFEGTSDCVCPDHCSCQDQEG